LGGDFPSPRYRKGLTRKPRFQDLVEPTDHQAEENANRFCELKNACR
jgi:hypothetical protein